MRPVTMLMFVMAVALVGSAAMAQTCPQPAPVQTCPQPCAPPPAACQPACPQPTAECPPPVQCAIPAQFGAGPVPKLCNLTCAADFDRSYIPAMYQQNADIITLATMGIEQTSDNGLRDLAIKIRNEREQQNQKLALFYKQAGGCGIPLDCGEMSSYRSQLMGLGGDAFNAQWATLMLGLLQQSQQAASMAQQYAGAPQLRDQANINAKASANEVKTLQRWLARHNLPTSAGVAVPGAGPCCPTGTTVVPSGPCCPAGTVPVSPSGTVCPAGMTPTLSP